MDSTVTSPFDEPVDFVEDHTEQGTDHTYIGDPIFQRETTGFASTVTDQYVLHGQWGKDKETPASLLVFQFQLRSNSASKGSRRFRKASIRLTFKSQSGIAAQDPAIRSYAPTQDGVNRLIPSKVIRENERHGAALARAQLGPAPVGVGFTYDTKDIFKWEKNLYANISASISTSGNERARKGYNVIEWTITENPREKQIPTTFQLAVLLERNNDKPFFVQAERDCSVDALYAIVETLKDGTQALSKLVGSKKPVRIFEPKVEKEIGRLDYPESPNLAAGELGLLSEGRGIDRFASIHVAELVEPRSIHGGIALTGDGQKQDDANRAEAGQGQGGDKDGGGGKEEGKEDEEKKDEEGKDGEGNDREGEGEVDEEAKMTEAEHGAAGDAEE